jgi:hypothetical protein
MSHYTTDSQGFWHGLGLRRSVDTLCGLTLDNVEDLGDGPCSCGECRRRNGEGGGRGGGRRGRAPLF